MFLVAQKGRGVVRFLGPVIPSQRPFVAAVILWRFHRSSSNRSGKSICSCNRKALVINLTNKEPFLGHAPEGGGVEQRKLTVKEVFVDHLDVRDAWTGKATVLFKDVLGCGGRSDELVLVHHHVVFVIVSYCCCGINKDMQSSFGVSWCSQCITCPVRDVVMFVVICYRLLSRVSSPMLKLSTGVWCSCSLPSMVDIVVCVRVVGE